MSTVIRLPVEKQLRMCDSNSELPDCRPNIMCIYYLMHDPGSGLIKIGKTHHKSQKNNNRVGVNQRLYKHRANLLKHNYINTRLSILKLCYTKYNNTELYDKFEVLLRNEFLQNGFINPDISQNNKKDTDWFIYTGNNVQYLLSMFIAAVNNFNGVDNRLY